MLQVGTAIKVTLYLNRDTTASEGFLADEVLHFLRDREVSGATVYEAHAGFGAHQRLHVDGAGDVSGLHLPLVICFVAAEDHFMSFRDELLTMVTDGLVEAHSTQVLRHVSGAAKVVA